MKYNEMTFGQMEAVINRLGGMDGVRRFLSGETVVKVLEQTLPTFPVWRTIKLGTGLKTADDFRQALKLKQAGCKISDWANNILGKPAFIATATEMEVDLVNVSVAELGFKEGATRKDIYDKAIKLGLELCPNEVGPQLRLQYRDQPEGERLRIAMKPIADSDGDLTIFYVVHDDDGVWLHGSNGYPDDFWSGDNRFVFVRPRK